MGLGPPGGWISVLTPCCLAHAQVLEACMKSCGKRFHDEVGKFRFLNELIKVVSPKVSLVSGVAGTRGVATYASLKQQRRSCFTPCRLFSSLRFQSSRRQFRDIRWLCGNSVGNPELLDRICLLFVPLICVLTHAYRKPQVGF